MAALADNKVVASKDGMGVGISTTPTVDAGDTIYRGAIVASNATQFAIPLVGAGANVQGIAQEYNVAGQPVQVLRGQQIECTVAGTPLVNALVYSATDNPDDATTVAAGATRIGYITEKSTSNTAKYWVLVAPTA